MATVLALPVGVVRSLTPSMFFLLHLLITPGTSTHLAPTGACACSGDTLMLKCTVVGKGTTAWFGSAFNCSNFENQIYLHHDQFSDGGAYGSCNNGSIVARGVSVEGNSYTSQLNVTVMSDKAGMTAGCYYYNGSNSFVELSLLVISTTGPPPAPSEVKMSTVNYSSREVTFSWSPVAPNCPAISYNILSSNCGSCPTTTNHTNVTCTDLPTDGTCTVAVQTVVDICKTITESPNNSISVHLTSLINLDRRSNRPSVISIISLATALVVSLVVSTTVIVICCIIMTRRKANIKALKLRLTTTAERHPHVYEDVTSAIPSISTINTQDNAAYSYRKAWI